jgi:hypothetical protein
MVALTRRGLVNAVVRAVRRSISLGFNGAAACGILRVVSFLGKDFPVW